VTYKTDDMGMSDYCFKYLGLYRVLVGNFLNLSASFQKDENKFSEIFSQKCPNSKRHSRLSWGPKK